MNIIYATCGGKCGALDCDGAEFEGLQSSKVNELPRYSVMYWKDGQIHRYMTIEMIRYGEIKVMDVS